jgi:hypothetical protein
VRTQIAPPQSGPEKVGIDGDAFILEASSAPPPAVLDLLSRHKVGIRAILRPAKHDWSGEDWLEFFD